MLLGAVAKDCLSFKENVGQMVNKLKAGVSNVIPICTVSASKKWQKICQQPSSLLVAAVWLTFVERRTICKNGTPSEWGEEAQACVLLLRYALCVSACDVRPLFFCLNFNFLSML